MVNNLHEQMLQNKRTKDNFKRRVFLKYLPEYDNYAKYTDQRPCKSFNEWLKDVHSINYQKVKPWKNIVMIVKHSENLIQHSMTIAYDVLNVGHSRTI